MIEACIILGRRSSKIMSGTLFYWIALGIALFTIVFVVWRLKGKRKVSPVLIIALCLLILVFVLLGGTREMSFINETKSDDSTATLEFESFDGGGPEYAVVMDSDIVSYTSKRQYAKEDHEDLNGAGYDVIFTFTGVKPGQADMTVEERSPIGDNEDHHYTVTVDSELRVEIKVKETPEP